MTRATTASSTTHVPRDTHTLPTVGQRATLSGWALAVGSSAAVVSE